MKKLPLEFNNISVGLRVRSINDSVKFYKDKLGFHLLEESETENKKVAVLQFGISILILLEDSERKIDDFWVILNTGNLRDYLTLQKLNLPISKDNPFKVSGVEIKDPDGYNIFVVDKRSKFQ